MAEQPASVVAPVKELAEKYRAEFEEAYELVRNLSVEISDNIQSQLFNVADKIQLIEPEIKQHRDQLLQCVQSVDPVEGISSNKILAIFSWISILQFGYMLAYHISGMVLYPFIGLIFGGFWATVLAFAVLPYYIYSKINTIEPVATMPEAGSDRQDRFKLLGFAVSEGALTGFLFCNYYLPSILPFAFLSPLVLAISAQFVIPNKSGVFDRIPTLGVCVGSGMAAHFVLGLLMGQLSVSYLVLTVLYSAIAFCTLQVYFKYRAENENADHLYMLGYLMSTIVFQCFVVAVFGGSKEPLIELTSH